MISLIMNEMGRFSTGFTSTADDGVNAERMAEVGREM